MICRKSSSRFPTPQKQLWKIQFLLPFPLTLWRIKAQRGTPSYLLLPVASLTGPNIQEPFRGWPFLMLDLCPCCYFSDICTASCNPLYTVFPSLSSAVVFFSPSLLLNLIRMTCLTFFIPPLCCVFFPGVSRGEQDEVDPCVYISVVPPPYCGIDVALWGLGLKRHREVDRGGIA